MSAYQSPTCSQPLAVHDFSPNTRQRREYSPMGIVRWSWKDTNGSHCGCLAFRTNRTAEKSDIFIFLDRDMGQSLKIIRRSAPSRPHDWAPRSAPRCRHCAVTVQQPALQTFHSALTKRLFANIFSWTACVRRRKKVPNKKCDLESTTYRVVGYYECFLPIRFA